MATKKSPAKKVAPAKVVAKAAPKSIKAPLNKTSLLAYIAEQSGMELKAVRPVLAALEDAIVASIGKKGSGTFILPGFLKITALKVPAKAKRKGVNPFTGLEQMFAAKPASVKIRVRPLKKLKDAVAA